MAIFRAMPWSCDERISRAVLALGRKMSFRQALPGLIEIAKDS
jgi:hypothetical protein